MAAYRQGEGSVDLGNAAGPEMKKVVSAWDGTKEGAVFNAGVRWWDELAQLMKTAGRGDEGTHEWRCDAQQRGNMEENGLCRERFPSEKTNSQKRKATFDKFFPDLAKTLNSNQNQTSFEILKFLGF